MTNSGSPRLHEASLRLTGERSCPDTNGLGSSLGPGRPYTHKHITGLTLRPSLFGAVLHARGCSFPCTPVATPTQFEMGQHMESNTSNLRWVYSVPCGQAPGLCHEHIFLNDIDIVHKGGDQPGRQSRNEVIGDWLSQMGWSRITPQGI